MTDPVATPTDPAFAGERIDQREAVRVISEWNEEYGLGLSISEAADLIYRLIKSRAFAASFSASAGVPEGYKLVPVEPTPEMYMAGACENVGPVSTRPDHIYRAMLAAAPPVSPSRQRKSTTIPTTTRACQHFRRSRRPALGCFEAMTGHHDHG